MLVLIYAYYAHLMVPQKFERKKNDSFPTKYRPDTRSQNAVCDLVKIVCDLTILYQVPEGPQDFFLLQNTPMGLTKNPWKCGKKKLVACLLFEGFNCRMQSCIVISRLKYFVLDSIIPYFKPIYFTILSEVRTKLRK